MESRNPSSERTDNQPIEPSADRKSGIAGQHGRVAAVGKPEVVAGLRALGLDPFPAGPADAAAVVERLAAQSYNIVFYTAECASALAPILEKHRRSAVPSIVELPSGPGSSGADRLKELVRRAVGADVFGKKE